MTEEDNNDRQLVRLEGGFHCWLNADERNTWREFLLTVDEYGRLATALDLKELMLAQMPLGIDILGDEAMAYREVCDNIMTEGEALYRIGKEWYCDLTKDPPYYAVAAQEDRIEFETDSDEFFTVLTVEDIPEGCYPVEVSFSSEGDIEARLRCGEETWSTPLISTGIDLKGELVLEYRSADVPRESTAMWDVVVIVGEE